MYKGTAKYNLAWLLLCFFLQGCQETVEISEYDDIRISIIAAYSQAYLYKKNLDMTDYEKVQGENYYVKKKANDEIILSKNDIRRMYLKKKGEHQWWISIKISNKTKNKFYEFTKRNIGAGTLIKFNNVFLEEIICIGKPYKKDILEIPFLFKPKKEVINELEYILEKKD